MITTNARPSTHELLERIQELNQTLTRVHTLAASWKPEQDPNAAGYNAAIQQLNEALGKRERIDQLPEFVRQNPMIIIDGQTFASPDDDLAGALPTSDSVYVHKHTRTRSLADAEAITSWAEHLPPVSIPKVITTERHPRLDYETQPMHYPVLDLDFPAELIPSSTPGHFHLYLGKAVPSAAYFTMLEAMVEAGLLEEGFVNASVARGYTAARMPWVHKKPGIIVEQQAIQSVFEDPNSEILRKVSDIHQPWALGENPGVARDEPICRACSEAWPCPSYSVAEDVWASETAVDVLQHLHREDLFRGHLSNGCKTCGFGAHGYPCATKSELGPEA